MRKYFTIYEDRRLLVIYDFGPNPSEFPFIVYEEIFISFLSVYYRFFGEFIVLRMSNGDGNIFVLFFCPFFSVIEDYAKILRQYCS
jgi:hypothetical protein